MYVALTRAKRHLAIIFPREGYNKMYGWSLNSPSRFIDGRARSIQEPWRVEMEQ